jgi:hypothetical protein
MSKSTSVYTTGAHLYTYQFPDGSWHWVVGEFEDDTFDDSGDVFNPKESAPTLPDLMTVKGE